MPNPPTPPHEQIDRHLWKHYLPTTTITGSKNGLQILYNYTCFWIEKCIPQRGCIPLAYGLWHTTPGKDLFCCTPLQEHVLWLYPKAVFTLDVSICVCINVTVKFNIVSMETQTQMHRMGLNPFSASMLTWRWRWCKRKRQVWTKHKVGRGTH